MVDHGDDPPGRRVFYSRIARAVGRGLRTRWPQIRTSLLFIAFVCSSAEHETLAIAARVFVLVGDVASSRRKQ